MPIVLAVDSVAGGGGWSDVVYDGVGGICVKE